MTLKEAIKMLDNLCPSCAAPYREHDMREFAMCQQQLGTAKRNATVLVAPIGTTVTMVELGAAYDSDPTQKPEPEPYNGY